VQVSPHVQAFDFSHRPFDIIWVLGSGQVQLLETELL
jgi:hypothetical protein